MGALYAREYSQFTNVKSVKGHKERTFRTIYLFSEIGSFVSDSFTILTYLAYRANGNKL